MSYSETNKTNYNKAIEIALTALETYANTKFFEKDYFEKEPNSNIARKVTLFTYSTEIAEKAIQEIKELLKINESTEEEPATIAINQFFTSSIKEYLEDTGLTFDKTIESSNYHKFIAWTIKDLSWSRLDDNITEIHKYLDNYIYDTLDFVSTNKISFNVRDCECLTDKDTGNKLFRTLVNFRINE